MCLLVCLDKQPIETFWPKLHTNVASAGTLHLPWWRTIPTKIYRSGPFTWSIFVWQFSHPAGCDWMYSTQHNQVARAKRYNQISPCNLLFFLCCCRRKLPHKNCPCKRTVNDYDILLKPNYAICIKNNQVSNANTNQNRQNLFKLSILILWTEKSRNHNHNKLTFLSFPLFLQVMRNTARKIGRLPQIRYLHSHACVSMCTPLRYTI